nr:mannose-6-phosphate isomerase [Leptinotarsa decemlineata]
MELKCKIQNYEWGKKGKQSKVATLYKNVNEEFTINENTPYAELWMGTHVNAPSEIKKTGETLASYISNHPDSLGKEVAESFKNELPFLFKVLSVNKALSIQAHPSKEHAEELHSKYPDIYRDPNHKPELAIALTPFEALCGFRPVSEIRTFVKNIPELGKIVSCSDVCDDVEFLKKAFRAVLTCDKQIIVETMSSLLKKFKDLDKPKREEYMADLVERLHSQFPNDSGILMVYFLNYLNLCPSEGIYLGANEPHAYLSGDCIENMACSDNVVRAGLTPKLVDVDTLCCMLNYKGERPEDKIFKPIQEDDHTRLYKPPVKDFAVAQINVPSSLGQYRSIKRKSASILIVIEGQAKFTTGELKPGTSLFLAANEELEILEVNENLLIYQAFANIF